MKIANFRLFSYLFHFCTNWETPVIKTIRCLGCRQDSQLAKNFRASFCNTVNLDVVLIFRVTTLMFKACVRYFLSTFYFSLNDSPSKTMKMFFISSKKLFSFSRYSNFCISVFPSFSSCQPLL